MHGNLPKPEAGMASTLHANIEALAERRRQERADASAADRVADRISRFAGSMAFVYIHLALYGGWIAANLGAVPGIKPWDESFVALAMIASVEAIFLSTFILISQNRMAAAADKRADLDLHITLLTEHELTKLAQVVDRIAARLEVSAAADAEFQETKRTVEPVIVLDAIERAESEDETQR